MTVRIEANRTSCVGAGQCVLMAPEVFDQGEDGLVVMIDDAPAEDGRDAARQAAELCPSASITVRET